MKNKTAFFFIIFLFNFFAAVAQKPFLEGSIDYKVRLVTADNKEFSGTYSFTFKGGQVRKDLRLSNGYQDVLIINTINGTAVTLQVKNGKKYAIQLNITEVAEKQKRYNGFVFKEDRNTGKIVAGITTFKGELTYTDGSHTEIYYTPEWRPDKGITFERFPNCSFMPLSFSFTEDNGVITYMEAEKVSIAPIENRVFRIPADYKVISNTEYRQIRR